MLEQLSQLPHAPSVPFQTTPSTTEVPEEVSGALIIKFLHVQPHLMLELLIAERGKYGSKAKTTDMEW